LDVHYRSSAEESLTRTDRLPPMSERSVYDWLAHARDSADPDEARRCLDAAANLARACYEWRAVLAALDDLPSVAPDRVAQLADTTLASAEAEGEVWGFRDVAAIRAGRLGDDGSARRALRTGLETLRRLDSPGYAWSILADGFIETVDDGPGARRCLDDGAESARRRGRASDMANISTALDKLGDRRGALALVAEAERMVDLADAGEVVWVAMALHELAEFRATTGLLTAATDRARTAMDATFLARSFNSHRDDRGTERAMARAAELAATADDWLQVAETSQETGRGDAAVRAALDRAAALVTDQMAGDGTTTADAAARERVAAGYLRLLGDSAAANRVGPRGARPGTRRPARRSMPGWNASPAPLFDWLRARVSDEVLAEIAMADHERDVDQHLAALLDIRDSGLVPRRLPWHPGEVVALSRWRRGERVNHLARAWCCTLLCLDEEEVVENMANIAPGLVESCLALGGPAPEHAGQLLAWVCETESEPDYVGDDEDGHAPVEALFALLLLCAGRDPADPRVDALISMIMSMDSDEVSYVHRLYGGSVIVDMWDELIGRLLVPLRGARPGLDRLLDTLGWPLEESRP
jgi:hypothetical protein